MAKIYVIAGPPGVGKSTSGSALVPDGIPILDLDLIADRYKKQGFTTYQGIANLSFQDLVRKELIAGRDFAIELNLGDEQHYDYVKSLKGFSGYSAENDQVFCLKEVRRSGVN
ncbi:hypothetical protein HH214_09805 [Mucilaginibacter robiniae]|uniref:UDP-N-acetylglucosamine kinase n=1 Tax=Mucilaginibacter robiniae TaxID=2728022 RepID=A0A7L5DYR3_9SPHI|nr:hypothetical protein [Mucilaginibacter robiniae]QJD96145.1 hypothetical protein HH214_09805 [Mucilaginibacter robiniae]